MTDLLIRRDDAKGALNLAVANATPRKLRALERIIIVDAINLGLIPLNPTPQGDAHAQPSGQD
ncbi:MAG TPA: hypothetical protein PKE55_11400 [Kiritimatiellia bacterium]|nr:hypothetical protein [Kiritimatiellia bacterium]